MQILNGAAEQFATACTTVAFATLIADILFLLFNALQNGRLAAIKINSSLANNRNLRHDRLEIEVAELSTINFIIYLAYQIRADFRFLRCYLHIV